MVVSVVLDTEYMGVAERNKWFLKVVSNAMKEDTLIVTHSYFRNHLEAVVEGCSDRFYTEFEMNRVSVSNIENLDICYIPDEWFDTLYEKCGSRSKQLIELCNNNNPMIEKFIEGYIDEALARRGEKRPDCIFNSLHVFEFVRAISSHYDCPIIPWVFSAIRKVHGYSQTLYMAHIDDNLFNSKACDDFFHSCESEYLGFPLFNKKEILALLGKRHNMPLLPLLDFEGVNELGIAGEGFHIIPEVYHKDHVTDDDIYYDAQRYYKSDQIVTRIHPMQLDQMGIGRRHMKNDPAAFILSCKRIATVQSQMIIKAAMWNRTAIAFSKALPYSELLCNGLNSTETVDDYKLNFILFAYFVPNSCMFDSEYWKWRFSSPSVSDIAVLHMKSIVKDLGIPFDVIMDKDHRAEKILSARGFSDYDIQHFLNPTDFHNVPIDYPTSYVRYQNSDHIIDSFFCLNHITNETIVSEFFFHDVAEECEFVLSNDIDGFIKIIKVSEDEQNLERIDINEHYYEKHQPVFRMRKVGSGHSIKIYWRIRPYNS